MAQKLENAQSYLASQNCKQAVSSVETRLVARPCDSEFADLRDCEQMRFRNSHVCCRPQTVDVSGLKLKYDTNLGRKDLETGSKCDTEIDKIS